MGPNSLPGGNQPYYTSSTVSAPCSQTSTQLSQPRHSSSFTGSALPSTSSNTSTGHTSTHSASPVHLSLSTVTLKLISSSTRLYRIRAQSLQELSSIPLLP